MLHHLIRENKYKRMRSSIQGISLLILVLMLCRQDSYAQNNNKGFRKIFDGKTTKNWEGDMNYWRVENGTLVGEVTAENPLKSNTFFIYRGGVPENFEFRAEYRISPEGNSGVQYRSEALENAPFGLKGYQADIDGANRYTGQNYEERGRGFLAMRGEQSLLKEGQKPIITGSVGNSEELKSKIRKDEWNRIHIIAEGNHIRHFINGVLMSDVTDQDATKRKMSGLIGLQLHVMPRMKVEYREIFLKTLK
jgi:hypothetical protein